MLHHARFFAGLFALTALTALPPAHAATLLEDYYSTFMAGNLEGQMGYTQTDASSDSPIEVVNGQVVITAGQTTNNQDLYKNFSAPVTASETETVRAFQSLKLTIDTVPAGNPTFFAALDAPDAVSFNNFRLATRPGSTAETFQLGTRVTGQAGYPFAFGEDLPLNIAVQVVLEADLNPGAQNDEARLYILPVATDARTVDFSTLTPYAISTYTSGFGDDPSTLGSFVLSQFGNASTQTSGVRIDETLIFIPEPATALALVGGLFLLCFPRASRR